MFTPITKNLGILFLGNNNTDIFSLNRQQVIDIFKSSGFLLFRGFPVDTEKFKTFTEWFGTGFMRYLGGAIPRDTINGDQTLLAVTGSKLHFAVPLHGEMYYMKHKPSLVWFYCITPPVSDGETTICDGEELYKQLTENTQNLLSSKKLKYVRIYPNGLWQKIYQTNDLDLVKSICQENNINLTINQENNSITTESIRPAIFTSKYGNRKVFINNVLPLLAGIMGETKSFVRFEDDLEIPEQIHQELKTVSDRLTTLISWQKGDILMVDNTRLLHGRRAYADNQRNICVRLSDAIF